jgi:isopentenyldiphosphate isomerase
MEECIHDWMMRLKFEVTHVPLFEEVRENLRKLNAALPACDRKTENAIEEVMQNLRDRRPDVRKKLRGEPADIVSSNDDIVGITEIGLAHMLGFRHRTANAVVFSPDGRIVCQRRVHNKRFALYLSVYGGHVISPATYVQAIREELREELRLPGSPQGELIPVAKERYEVEGDLNVEIRKLYLYWLSAEELRALMQFACELESKKREKTLNEYKQWIEGEQKSKSGYGEVWGVYEVKLSNLLAAPTTLASDEEMGGQMELHYVDLVDIFSDGEHKDRAFFTPDLLEMIVRNPKITRILRSAADLEADGIVTIV